MKRFLVSAIVQLVVFGLLGASIWTAAGLVLFAFMFWHADLSLDTATTLAGLFPLVFPYALAYASGITILDFVAALLKIRHRIILCALVGLASLDWLCVMVPDPSRMSAMSLVGISLLGAVPAAFCSWLCREIVAGRLPGGWPLVTPMRDPAAQAVGIPNRGGDVGVLDKYR